MGRGIHCLGRNFHVVAEPDRPWQHAERCHRLPAIGEGDAGEGIDPLKLAAIFSAQPVEGKVVSVEHLPEKRHQRRHAGRIDARQAIFVPATMSCLSAIDRPFRERPVARGLALSRAAARRTVRQARTRGQTMLSDY